MGKLLNYNGVYIGVSRASLLVPAAPTMCNASMGFLLVNCFHTALSVRNSCMN